MRILNYGSLNIDYVYTVDHIVPGGETISSSRLQVFTGGKGLNQSVALARAGAAVSHAGCIGTDGQFLKELLADCGADTSRITTGRERTGNAIIQVDRNGQNAIVLFSGTNREMTEEKIERDLADFSEGDWLLLQNEINLNARIMELAYAKGMRIVLNPSPMDEDILALPLEKVSCFILNELEGARLAGETEPEQILQKLLQRFPEAELVLTLGQDGSVYAYRDTVIRQGIFPCKAVDTTGAGDTFTGYYLASRMRGEDPETAMRLAAMAASIAVSRPGAAPSIPVLSEVEAAVRETCKKSDGLDAAD